MLGYHSILGKDGVTLHHDRLGTGQHGILGKDGIKLDTGMASYTSAVNKTLFLCGSSYSNNRGDL